MASNLLLVAGPIVGLVALRAGGPVRPLPALATAIGCQLATFYGYAYLWRPYVAPMLDGPSAERPVLIATFQPTLASRLSVLASLVVIASVVAGFFLAAQHVVSRGTSDPPPAA